MKTIFCLFQQQIETARDENLKQIASVLTTMLLLRIVKVVCAG